MNIVNVYTEKEYTCNSCNGKVYYAKLKKEDGSFYTEDEKPFNGVFGKGGNLLSVRVSVDDQEHIHKCDQDKVYKIVDENNGVKHVPQPTTQTTILKEFKPEFVNTNEQAVWNDIVGTCAEYAILAKQKLDEYPEIDNPQFKGLVTKLAFEVRMEMKRKQDKEKEEAGE